MSFLRSVIGVACTIAFLAACGGALNPAVGGNSTFNPNARTASVRAASSGYKQLYAFQGHPDGASPYGGLVEMNGTLYGTTLNGSKNYCSQSCGSNHCYLGCGTIFTIEPSGGENIIYNFDGTFNGNDDGAWPFVGLTPFNGALYGTTSGGGSTGDGTVFTTSASGNESVIYSFNGSSGSPTDGSDPEAVLTPFSSTLYGTTVYGGVGCNGAGCGTVYSVNASGNESVLYRFQGGQDGYRVFAPVIVFHKKLYGATLQGGGTGCGGDGCGTIFELTLHGKERVLYRFGGSSDGAYPNGLIAIHGLLYGTTEGGGSKNSGTFFSVTPSGKLTTLYNFLDIPDGNLPGATLIYSKGKFYGTTVGGGTAGDGTVFSINRTGTKEKVLYSFKGGSDGAAPEAPVYLSNHELYGTTQAGGNGGCANNAGCGTVFKLKP